MRWGAVQPQAIVGRICGDLGNRVGYAVLLQERNVDRESGEECDAGRTRTRICPFIRDHFINRTEVPNYVVTLLWYVINLSIC